MEISSLMAPLVLDSWQIYMMSPFRRNTMSRNLLLPIFIFGLVLYWTASPSLAHYSISAEFDNIIPVQVTGVVKKVEWMNPHSWFYVEGKDEVNGRTALWVLSSAPPSTLPRRGIKSDVPK